MESDTDSSVEGSECDSVDNCICSSKRQKFNDSGRQVVSAKAATKTFYVLNVVSAVEANDVEVEKGVKTQAACANEVRASGRAVRPHVEEKEPCCHTLPRAPQVRSSRGASILMSAKFQGRSGEKSFKRHPMPSTSDDQQSA